MNEQTDYEKLLELFTKFGIVDLKYTGYDEPTGGYGISIAEGRGYAGFGASFMFDKDGKFIYHSVSE